MLLQLQNGITSKYCKKKILFEHLNEFKYSILVKLRHVDVFLFLEMQSARIQVICLVFNIVITILVIEI